jgi:hypothetical protein
VRRWVLPALAVPTIAAREQPSEPALLRRTASRPRRQMPFLAREGASSSHKPKLQRTLPESDDQGRRSIGSGAICGVQSSGAYRA